MSTIEQQTQGWEGAVIVITENGRSQFRPAVFVYDIPDGFAWVEPSYADPVGAASPAFHEARGVLVAPNMVTTGPRLIRVLPYDPDEDVRIVGESIEWYKRWLGGQRRTWDEERRRVLQLVKMVREEAGPT